MKILVISNLYPPHGIGGYEERCRYCVNHLRAREHEVFVLTSDYTTGSKDINSEPFVRRVLQINGFFGRPWLPIHRLWKLERHNQNALRSTIQEFQPDVIHVWNMGGISKSLLHTLEAQPVKVVYDISDHWIARSLAADVWLSWWNDPGSIGRNWLRGILTVTGLRKLINRYIPTAPVTDLKFEKIYFCSRFMRDLTVSKGYQVEHASVIYCGIDTDQFVTKTNYTKPLRYLWVGRLAEDKDPLTAIQGFLLARAQSGLPLELHLYGKGSADYQHLLIKEIKQAGADSWIQIRSASHAEMKSLYAKYDAYIFSSNWGEPFALTPLESMASGVPVIMCPDGGDAELLNDGVNAIAFSAANPASLAEAILKLLDAQDYGRQIAQTALQQVRSAYSSATMCDHIETTLQRAIGKS